MQKLDFLSGAPKTFIFEKSSNKTNLGGVFTLIYLIIVLIISLAYIVDYEANPKYEAQSHSEHFFNNDEEYMINKRKNKKLNPELSFSFGLDSETINESEFIIIQGFKNESTRFLEFGEEYKSFASDFNFFWDTIVKILVAYLLKIKYKHQMIFMDLLLFIQDIN